MERINTGIQIPEGIGCRTRVSLIKAELRQAAAEKGLPQRLLQQADPEAEKFTTINSAGNVLAEPDDAKHPINNQFIITGMGTTVQRTPSFKGSLFVRG